MEWLFLVVSFVAVLAAGMMLTRQNAVHSALFLIVNFGCVAFLYLMLDAPFLAMVQVTVYTGAIMVLFLFVIMLLGAETTTDTSGRMRWLGFAGTAVAILLLLIFAFPLASNMLSDETVEQPDAQARIRVINAIPGGEAQIFTVMDMGRAMNLRDTVRGNILLDPVADATDETRLVDVIYEYGRESAQDYLEVAAGDYTVIVGVGGRDFESAPIYSESRLLEPDSAHSVMIYENDQGFVDVAVLDDDISAPAVGKMRLTLFNAVTDKQVSLVDIGQYTARGTLCDDSSCGSLIPHRVLIELLPGGQRISLELEAARITCFADEIRSARNVLDKPMRLIEGVRARAGYSGQPGQLPRGRLQCNRRARFWQPRGSRAGLVHRIRAAGDAGGHAAAGSADWRYRSGAARRPGASRTAAHQSAQARESPAGQRDLAADRFQRLERRLPRQVARR